MNESRWKWVAVLALGMVAGLAMAQVLSVRTASAQPRQWQECFGASLYEVSGRNLNSGELPERVRVAGWVPVGGTTIRGSAAVVLCR
jgi:hypothetical protein